MKRAWPLLVIAVLACAGIGGYVWWSESAGNRELEQLRERRVESLPTVQPVSGESGDGETADGEEAEVKPLTAAEILDFANAQWDNIEDYHCTTTVFCRAGEETEDKVLDVMFKRPALFRNTVIEGANEGSVVTYNSEGIIHGRRAGALSLIVLTLKPDDERIRSLRGRRFYEAAWGVEYDEIREKMADGWQLKRLDDGDLDGMLCYVIAGEGTSDGTPLTKSEMWIEQATHLLRRRIDYEGDTLVRDARFTQIEINTDPDDSLFSLK